MNESVESAEKRKIFVKDFIKQEKVEVTFLPHILMSVSYAPYKELKIVEK